MNHISLRHIRKMLAASLGGAAMLLAASDAHAADNYYRDLAAIPVWDNNGVANWSLGAAPTAFDNAIFPAVPGNANAAAVGLRADGTEIMISQGVGTLTSPIADNLVFFNSYKLTSNITPVAFGFLVRSSFLTLRTGNVTVDPSHTVILDTNVVLLQDKLTKLGDGELIVVSGRTIFGNVLVKEGLFGGTGTVQGDLTNSSIVAPGNSPGTLYVTKNYKQTEDGTLRIEIASASKYDRLNVGGDASLEGDLKVALVNGYQPGKGKKFTILTAGGEVTGQFDEVSAPVWDNLTLRAFYEDDHVFLKTVIHSFEAVAQTPNQAAVAHVLDEVVYDPRADKLLRQLYKSDFDQLPGDLDELAPDELTSIFSISTSLANVQSLNLQRRTDDIRRGSSGFSASGLAMQGTGPGYSGGLFGAAGPSGYEGKDVKEVKDVVPVDEKKWGAFLTGVGEWVDVDGDGNARGFDITTGGFTLGLDYKVCSNFAIGIAAGYAGTAADLTNDGRVWVNGGKLGVYATAFAGGWYGDFAVNGGYNSYDTKRSVLGGTARGDTEGGELNVLVGTGYDWKIGALQIGPTATFQYTLVGMDDFTENGSLAPLAIGGRNEESLRTSLGFKASADLHAGSVVVRPELRASWQHEFSETSYGLDASFASGAGGNFLVNGPEIGRDSLMVGVGVAVLFNDTVSTYLYYDGELFRDNYEKHSVSGGIRVAF